MLLFDCFTLDFLPMLDVHSGEFFTSMKLLRATFQCYSINAQYGEYRKRNILFYLQ